jgi:hypothetical protein
VHAQLIWNSFAQTGNPPAGYKMANIQYLTHYQNEMEKEFCILQLCTQYWKADHVWVLNYPSWLWNWEKKVQWHKEKKLKSAAETEEGPKCKRHDETPTSPKNPKKKKGDGKTTHDCENIYSGSNSMVSALILVVSILIHHYTCLSQSVASQPSNPLSVVSKYGQVNGTLMLLVE